MKQKNIIAQACHWFKINKERIYMFSVVQARYVCYSYFLNIQDTLQLFLGFLPGLSEVDGSSGKYVQVVGLFSLGQRLRIFNYLKKSG